MPDGCLQFCVSIPGSIFPIALEIVIFDTFTLESNWYLVIKAFWMDAELVHLLTKQTSHDINLIALCKRVALPIIETLEVAIGYSIKLCSRLADANIGPLVKFDWVKVNCGARSPLKKFPLFRCIVVYFSCIFVKFNAQTNKIWDEFDVVGDEYLP